MSDALRLELTHGPLLAGTHGTTGDLLCGTLADPDMPANAKDLANWPQHMHQEWSDGRFARVAATQRPDLVKRLARYPKAHHEFRADPPVEWGDDQFGFLHSQRGR